MAAYGDTLSSEEHGPIEIVDAAVMAEDAGFAWAWAPARR